MFKFTATSYARLRASNFSFPAAMAPLMTVADTASTPYWSTIITSPTRKARLRSVEHFYSPKEADALLQEITAYPGLQFTKYLITEDDGQQHWVTSPRKMMWCSENSQHEYRFSANHNPGLPAHPLTPTLQYMQQKLETELGERFNAVLINIYEDGSEHSAWHSDDDPWLGKDFTVPSISLGHERAFGVRPKEAHTHTRSDEHFMQLTHGSLTTMEGSFQDEYQHSVPPEEADHQKKSKYPYRVNLTWRYVRPDLEHLHNIKATWGS